MAMVVGGVLHEKVSIGDEEKRFLQKNK